MQPDQPYASLTLTRSLSLTLTLSLSLTLTRTAWSPPSSTTSRLEEARAARRPLSFGWSGAASRQAWRVRRNRELSHLQRPGVGWGFFVGCRRSPRVSLSGVSALAVHSHTHSPLVSVCGHTHNDVVDSIECASERTYIAWNKYARRKRGGLARGRGKGQAGAGADIRECMQGLPLSRAPRVFLFD